MKKMPTLFVRKFDETNPNGTPKRGSKFTLTEEVTPGCEWVLNGEGVATRKWDGTAVNISGGSIYRRYDAKHGRIPPEGFIPCQDPDRATGHWPGWIRIDHMIDKGQDKWIWEAVFNTFPGGFTNGKDGTYEAIGPKINGNKDNVDSHRLQKHGDTKSWLLSNVQLTFETIKQFISTSNVEGIVFHHPDGRMCKIKRSDFGLKW